MDSPFASNADAPVGEPGSPGGLDEEVLRSLLSELQHLPVAAAILDARGRYLMVSRRWAAEFDLEREVLAGRSHFDCFEEDGGQWRGRFARVARGEVVQEEARLERRGGRAYWVRVELRPWYRREGVVGGCIVFAENRTEQQEAAAALHESEQRFRAIFDSTFQFIGLMKPDGTLIEANQTALDFGGLRPEDVIGKPFWECFWWQISPETQAQLKEAVGRAASGHFVRYDVSVQGAGGRIATIDFSIKPVRDERDQVVLLLPEGRDITDQKQAEDALYRERQFLSAVLENTQAGIAACNADGMLTLFNRATRQLHGLSERPLPPDRWAEHYDLYRADGKTPMAKEDIPLFRAWQGEQVQGAEMMIIPKEGEAARTLVASGQSFYDARGEKLGAVVAMHDITELKRAQQELEASRRLLSSVLANALDGVMAFRAVRDEAGQIIDFEWLLANPTSEELTGFAPDELIGRRLLEVMPGNREAGLFGIYVRVVETGESYEHEFYYDHEGMQAWFHNTVVKLSDGFAVTFRDVTARREAEQALRARELQLARAQRIAHLGSWEWDVQTGELIWSDELCRIYGLEPGSVRSLEDFTARVHPADLPSVQHAIETALRTHQPFSFYHRIVRSDGTQRILHGEGEVMRDDDGTVLKMLGTGRDVTEARQAEVELSKREERYRLLAENMTDLVALHEPDGTYTYLSPSVERILGFSPQDLLGTSFFDYVHPEDLEHVRGEMAAQQRAGSTFWQVPLRVRTHSGVYLWLDLTVRIIRDEEGTVVRLQSSARDVTERVWAERELARSHAVLRQRNRELQDFTYVASHDLQEPLRKIRAFADLMREDYGEAIDEAGRYYLQRMQEAAARMSRLISDLLAFSRVSTKAQPFEPVDLKAVAADVVSDLEMLIDDVGGRVDVGPLPTLDADPTQMRQLLQNLIGNALKFHHAGVPPVVRVAAEIRPAAEEAGEDVCVLQVADNGIGFDEKYLDRIFTPFKRLHGRDKYTGTGMGLAICRRIVERHHGAITAHSAPSAGATFIITLPLRQDASQEDADPYPDHAA